MPPAIPVSALPPGFNVAEVSGPLIVACLLHWGLFGTLSVQIYLYYEAFPNDRPFNKYLVYGVYIVEFVQTILVTHDAFAMFGDGFGDVKALTDIHTAWLTVPIMSGLVALTGQAFYAYRIRLLSKSWWISTFILLVSLASTVGAFVTGVFTYQAGNMVDLNNHKTSIAVGFWCGGSAISDIVIAFCMTYYLLKNETAFRHTKLLVSKLIRLSIETGTVTAVVALCNLILFFAFPGKTYYTTPALLMPKFYANTILAVLNSRFQIVGGRSDTTSSSTFNSIPSYLVRDGNTRSPQDTLRSPIVAIRKEVFSDSDLDDRVEMKGVNVTRSPESSCNNI